ncbi:MAG: periplasmic heavy metal sensor [Desulfovibrionaceae bacterium]|nr:periplasmic heavy metal sensor [Desulfovibrionaceae bacterium]
MRNMRHFLAGWVGVSLVFCSVSAACAHGHDKAGRLNGGWDGCFAAPHAMLAPFQGLTEEKRAELDALAREHRAAVEPLREQLEARHLELNALSGNPNMRPEDISRLAKEVAGLRARIRTANQTFREKAQELGVPVRPRAGMRGACGRRAHPPMRGCS